LKSIAARVLGPEYLDAEENINEKESIIKLLIENGFCGIDVKDTHGKSPLGIARKHGFEKILRMFEELHRVKKNC
jgi:hypothetical protein